MSQKKVDKYKEEKKNRGKKLKRKKIKKVIAILLAACFIGGCIGFPLGKYLYKRSAEEKAHNETIGSTFFDYWLDEYLTTNGYYDKLTFADDMSVDDIGTETDATATDSDATATDAN